MIAEGFRGPLRPRQAEHGDPRATPGKGAGSRCRTGSDGRHCSTPRSPEKWQPPPGARDGLDHPIRGQNPSGALGQTVLLPPLAKNKPSRFDGRGSWLPHASIAGTSGYTTPDTPSGRRGMRSARGGRAAIGTGGSSAICVATPGISRASRTARTSNGTSVSTARRSSARSGGRFGAGRTISASGVRGGPSRTDVSIVSSTTVAIRGRRI